MSHKHLLETERLLTERNRAQANLEAYGRFLADGVRALLTPGPTDRYSGLARSDARVRRAIDRSLRESLAKEYAAYEGAWRRYKEAIYDWQEHSAAWGRDLARKGEAAQ